MGQSSLISNLIVFSLHQNASNMATPLEIQRKCLHYYIDNPSKLRVGSKNPMKEPRFLFLTKIYISLQFKVYISLQFKLPEDRLVACFACCSFCHTMTLNKYLWSEWVVLSSDCQALPEAWILQVLSHAGCPGSSSLWTTRPHVPGP